MTDYVTDTHALYWYLKATLQLSAKARAVFLAGEQGHARIHLPNIVLAELYYLNVKEGRPLDFAQEHHRLASAGQFRFVDFRAADVVRFDALVAIPEMHDRTNPCTRSGGKLRFCVPLLLHFLFSPLPYVSPSLHCPFDLPGKIS